MKTAQKMKLTKKVQILVACLSLTLLFACKEDMISPDPITPIQPSDTIPSAPQNLKVFVLGPTSVLLKWQPPANLGKPVMTKYLIYRAIGNGESENVGSVDYGTSTTFSNSSLTSSTSYKYHVIAANTNGESGKSNLVEAVPHKLGTNDIIYSLSFVGTELYAGGDFIEIGGNNNTDNIAKWNGSVWSEFSPDPSSTIYAIADNETDVYIGGSFTNLGTRIAKKNGSGWTALGSGVGTTGERVNSILIDGNNIYAGGNFTQAGMDLNIDYFTRWNGSSWTEPGAPGITVGSGNMVNAIAKHGDDIIIGGDFEAIGSMTTDNVAIYKVSSNSFTALGLGLSGGDVHTLASSGNAVYAGGAFTNSGGSNNPMVRFAKFDGAWVNLGSAVNETVYAIAVSGNDVYVGGNFTSPGNHIAKWDGTSWSNLGTGVNGRVNSIVINGSDVYVGGDFTRAGDRSAGSIAKWDGTEWYGF